MPEYIRVRDTSGHEISVRSDVPEGHPRGQQEGQKRVDRKAPSATAEPPKYRTALGTPRPGSKVDRQRKAAKKTTPASEPGESGGQTVESEKGI